MSKSGKREPGKSLQNLNIQEKQRINRKSSRNRGDHVLFQFFESENTSKSMCWGILGFFHDFSTKDIVSEKSMLIA